MTSLIRRGGGTVVLLFGLLLLCGCGALGPTLPGPGGAVGRTLQGVVVENVFIVPAGQRFLCIGDVTVRCDRAEIHGELVGQCPQGPGQAGGDIAIESQGDILVTGTIAACDGVDGDADADGGGGGAVRLASVDGAITIGADQAAGGSEKPFTHIGSGVGGNGGDGHSGGAGGTGGDILLQCPNGTLTIHPASGMFDIGNGGHGGTGVVGGEDLLTMGPPEQLTNGGGDSGGLGADYQAIAGVAIHDVATSAAGQGPQKYGVLDEGVGSGGIGGDAGGYYYGVDPATGNAAWPSTPSTSGRYSGVSARPEFEVRGDDGGSGTARGGDAAPVIVDMSRAATPDNTPGPTLWVWGGSGGSAGYTGVAAVAGFFTSWHQYGGAGGDATCIGYRGGDGSDCSRGALGGEALVRGGWGGSAAAFRPQDKDRHPGPGGKAVARGGPGGQGGACCSPPPRRGGSGGPGGGADAVGGPGGDFSRGPGGDAEAFGGDGGRGGDGVPAGHGGLASSRRSGTVEARGGKGDPPGSVLGEHAGKKGAEGEECPGLRGTINGRLTEADGTPIGNFQVTLTNLGDGTTVETFTDAQGRYAILEVPPGDYEIVPDAAGSQAYWEPAKRTVAKVAFQDLVDQDFVRRAQVQEGYTVTVPVLCEEGQPKDGVVILLWGGGLTDTLQAITGAGGVEGLADFNFIPPGLYKAKVDSVQSPPPPTYEWTPYETEVHVLNGDVMTVVFQPVPKQK